MIAAAPSRLLEYPPDLRFVGIMPEVPLLLTEKITQGWMKYEFMIFNQAENKEKPTIWDEPVMQKIVEDPSRAFTELSLEEARRLALRLAGAVSDLPTDRQMATRRRELGRLLSKRRHGGGRAV